MLFKKELALLQHPPPILYGVSLSFSLLLYLRRHVLLDYSRMNFSAPFLSSLRCLEGKIAERKFGHEADLESQDTKQICEGLHPPYICKEPLVRNGI